MSYKTAEFENPDNLPAEKLKLTVRNVGVVQQIKALDAHWALKDNFVLYERPPTGEDLVFGAVDAWVTRMADYCDNLQTLLALEHHRFWSTLVYHPTCMDCIVSFLQEADPPYLPPHDSKNVQNLYGDIRKYVLVVFSRLCTNKESPTRWISKEYMSDLIYNNFIFTIPIIWDICLVYGLDNTQHMARLVNSVFTLQPKYNQDAKAALGFVNEAFKFIILQVNKDYDAVEPPNLPETFAGFSEIKRPTSKQTNKLTFGILRDLVLHMLDTAMTVRIYVQVYPKAVKVISETNLVNSVVQLYEYGIPQMYEKLEELGDPVSLSYSEVEGHLDSARTELIDVFREILTVYKNDVLSKEGNIEAKVEAYLSVMMDGLSEKLLIQDYHSCYPVHEDLELLRQACPQIDSVKTDFILQAIYSNMDEPIPERLVHNNATNGRASSNDSEDGPEEENACASTSNGIPAKFSQEAAISEVKNILPDLGDGFILKCLYHYGFNSEKVINCLLEGTLDPSLKDVDQSLPIIPEDPLDKVFLETGVTRLNIFDGDEFDVMTRDDIDWSRVHKGKRKEKYRDAKDLLDDKTEIRKFADLYTKYSLIKDDSIYSDEYDDTYDCDGMDRVVPLIEAADARPIVTPRVLQTPRREQHESPSSSEDDGPSTSGATNNRLDFCVNPEEMRARREAAYQARRGRGKTMAQPRSTDVQGQPRGKGQEKQVLVNRDKKEKHKSSRGNHNRRQGASFKRSQGMMPS